MKTEPPIHATIANPVELAPTLLTHDAFHKKADAILDLYIDHNIQQQETFHALHLLHQTRNRQMNGV